MCDETAIKELLAPYQEQTLDKPEQSLVESHLASCEDCRLELSLISMMTEEQVPDPGTAFWAVLPGRLYRAVQEEQQATKSFGIDWILDRVALPRWALASATLATLLLLSWSLFRPVPLMVASRDGEFAGELMAGAPVQVAELDSDELAMLDRWAVTALVSLVKDAEQAIGSVPDGDLYEEVAELNAREAEQLLKLIEQRAKEVSS